MSVFWKRENKEDRSWDSEEKDSAKKSRAKKDSAGIEQKEYRERWNENAIKTLLEAEEEARKKEQEAGEMEISWEKDSDKDRNTAGEKDSDRDRNIAGEKDSDKERNSSWEKDSDRERNSAGEKETDRETEGKGAGPRGEAESQNEMENQEILENRKIVDDQTIMEHEAVTGEQEKAEESKGDEETEQAEKEDVISPLLDKRILRAIKEMGFENFSPIQEEAIPYLLRGEDIIGQAQTGTGKTAAFGIPAIMKIDPELKKLQTIILCPTRELAIQAAEELRRLAKYMIGTKVLPVYGGQEISKQIKGLKGVQIIVGTPGRVMDHMRRHTIKLDDINMVVLDEADEMLNMGFREDMETILGQIPNEHQTALFSATMPKPILEITKQFQKDAKMIKIAAKELTIPLVSQKYYRIKSKDKDAACVRLLEYYQPKLALIFCNTKRKVDEVSEMLKKSGFQAEALHGDMSQHQRDMAMGRFRNGSTNILIATDVAARGIDVDNVEAVINYDIPQDIEYYVHRIGRTGRAGKRGRSFTFVSGREIFQLRDIERICHTTVEEKKLPGASKVLKTKADKYLNQAWELHEHEDMELMKKYLERKMEEEECDALELAAAMLKLQIGDRAEEIQVDDYAPKKKGKGESGRSRGGSGRKSSGRDIFGGREGRDRGEGRRDRSGRGEEGKSRKDRYGEEGGSRRDGYGEEGRARKERNMEEGGSRRDGYVEEGRARKERNVEEGRSRRDGYVEEGRARKERNVEEGRSRRDRNNEEGGSRRGRYGDESRGRRDGSDSGRGRERKESDSRKERRDGHKRKSEEGSGKKRGFGNKKSSGRKSYFM